MAVGELVVPAGRIAEVAWEALRRAFVRGMEGS